MSACSVRFGAELDVSSVSGARGALTLCRRESSAWAVLWGLTGIDCGLSGMEVLRRRPVVWPSAA